MSRSAPRPWRVDAYLDALVRLCAERGRPAVSVVLFGSVASGGFSDTTSDVDLIVVLPDDTSRAECRRLRGEIEHLEFLHGFRDSSSGARGRLDTFVERAVANALSCFVCTRADFLSGDVARILDLTSFEARFVDRIVLATIMASATTARGEELLAQMVVPPIRRRDLFQALHAFSGQVLMSIALYPVRSEATKYAMGALKRSVHSCHFYMTGRAASLGDEVEFMQRRFGRSATLAKLLVLRAEYRRSLAFVVRCLPAIARLHVRTAIAVPRRGVIR